MKRRGLTTALTALAALTLSIAVLVPAAMAAPASPAATAPSPQGMMGGGTGGGSWCGGGIWNGSGQWGGTGMWGTGYGAGWLAKNPAAFRAWLQLKADHIKAMQTCRGLLSTQNLLPQFVQRSAACMPMSAMYSQLPLPRFLT